MLRKKSYLSQLTFSSTNTFKGVIYSFFQDPGRPDCYRDQEASPPEEADCRDWEAGHP